MKKIIIGILIMTLVFLAGCINVGTDTDEEDPVASDPPVQTWTWDLIYGWNYITFTQVQLDACRSDAPRDVFSSIMGSVDGVFQKQNDEYKVWSTDLPDWVIDLNNVLPNVECEIHCIEGCILTI